MKIDTDWHIHSRNSCDEASLTVADLVTGAAARGIDDFGLTDHVHTPFNLPDVARSRAEFLSCGPSPRFHFGVEVSCVSQWEIDEIARGHYESPTYGLRSGGQPGCALAIGLTQDDIRTYQIEYVVGGTHWPIYVNLERHAVIRDYHRQNMFLATHPLVDIVAHPWWWMGHWQDANGNYPAEPWFDDFGVIPPAMHDEFAAALLESDTKVEINIGAMLLNPRYPEGFASVYLEYMAGLQSRGVRLSIGSDCHSDRYDAGLEEAAQRLDRAGIEADFWCLAPRAEEVGPGQGATRR